MANYFSSVIMDSLLDLRERILNMPNFIGTKEFDALINFLAQNEVDVLYTRLRDGSLPKDVRQQYDLFADIVQELAR